ncbi:MAG: hypothetical protein H6Q58_1294 [Firmicutes bacterium]|nr:hypothetical protein [Bacillota bacterium]
MVKVVLTRDSGKLISYRASGHAGSVDEGYDMVCSAISASSIMIANGITDVLNLEPSITVDDGFLHIDLRNLAPGEVEKCQVLMETLLLGVKSIEQNYGKYIIVKVKEV